MQRWLCWAVQAVQRHVAGCHHAVAKDALDLGGVPNTFTRLGGWNAWVDNQRSNSSKTETAGLARDHQLHKAPVTQHHRRICTGTHESEAVNVGWGTSST